MPEVITNNLDFWSSALLTKSAAGRGRNGKQEAYGIKKLRELILELAVRGKLVPQDPNDEPASVLLTRVLEENTRLLQEKNKKPIEVPLITVGEINFELPQGWEYVRNGSLFSLRKGKKPKNIAENQIGLPYLDIEALDRDNILRFTDDDKCPRATEEDILVVCDGSRSGLVLDGKNGVIGSTLAVIDTPKMIQPFIKLLFMESYERLNSTMKGAAIPHLDTNSLILEIVGLPPLGEQQGIVAKVDELMAMCDQLEQQQTHSIEAHQTLVEILLCTLIARDGEYAGNAGAITGHPPHKEFTEAWTRIANHFDTLFTTEHSVDQLKQTILQLAVMGKLVPQDPTDEPASLLLERLKRKRDALLREGKVQNAKFVQTVKKEDVPYELPRSWVWTRLSFIAEVIDPNPSHRMPRYVDAGIPFVSTENFIDNDNIDFSIGKCVTDEILQEQTDKFELRPGAFALSRIGTIGKTRPLPLERNYCLSHALCVISPFDDELNTDYLRLAVTADSVLEQAHAGTKSIGVPDLGMGVIRSFLLSLPPKCEQHRIVAKVDELIALCDALKARLADARTTQIHLADVIVEQAVA